MKKENILKGIIGGFIGSLAGVVAIVLFSKLGYVAAIAGLIMAVCTINLYQKFAGGFSKKGIIICSIIMIIMTIVGNNLAFSFALVGELKEYYNVDSSVMYIFFNLFSLMREGLIVISTYVGDLMLIVIFNLLGAIGVFKTQLKKINASNVNNNGSSQINNTITGNNQTNLNNVNIQNNMNTNYTNNINPNNINTNYTNNINPNNINTNYTNNTNNTNINNINANYNNSNSTFNQNNTNMMQ